MLTSLNPKGLYDLHPGGGTLEPGADADITLIDLDADRTLCAGKPLSFAA